MKQIYKSATWGKGSYLVVLYWPVQLLMTSLVTQA